MFAVQDCAFISKRGSECATSDRKYTFNANLIITSLVVLAYVPDCHCCFSLHLPFCHLKSELVFSVIYICGCAPVCVTDIFALFAFPERSAVNTVNSG